jgi:DNA-binding transcriptional MerR regulator
VAKRIYYKIGEACKLLDIQPYVLRYWETEFPMLRPDKSSSGQRVYSESDLATIRRIKVLLYDEGYTIAGAKKKLDGEDLSEPMSKPATAAAAAEPKAKPEPKSERSAPKQAASPKNDAPARKGSPEKKAMKDAGDSKDADALRKGVSAALHQARGILELLDSKSAKR